MAVVGLKKILANSKSANASVRNTIPKALLTGGLHVQGKSQKLVPVEYGFLRASAYTMLRGRGLAVEIGYTALYAAAIHENMEQRLKGIPRPSGIGVYWGPAGQPKFLEQPFYGEAHVVARLLQRAGLQILR